MSVIAEAEELALSLPKADRAKLVSKLIASFGTPFEDVDDDGLKEALRRDREMDENPGCIMTEEEFFASFEEYRR